MLQKKKNGKYITTAKESICLQGEGTTENAAIQMLQVFLLFIKGQKKNCYKMFLISGILFATERMRNYLFHWRLFK